MSGGYLCTVPADPTQSVATLRRAIATEMNIKVQELQLLDGTKDLEDKDLLGDTRRVTAGWLSMVEQRRF